MRLDVVTVAEVRWTPYRPPEIHGVCFSTYHDLLAYFTCVEPHMPERCARQFGRTQEILHAPIISPLEHCRLTSTKSYVAKHTFTKYSGVMLLVTVCTLIICDILLCFLTLAIRVTCHGILDTVIQGYRTWSYFLPELSCHHELSHQLLHWLTP
ncbi:hypothetical protein M9H77_05185 [Catharanthus roseus]|uniref:Uncharacterized protein n=1 Tax=Catharanthus roseus TaxID=4058 RepID=A0ACC0CGI0_CATRO|nr:hypothetical protein M9H77_05185 [Catharanthus roseus]